MTAIRDTSVNQKVMAISARDAANVLQSVKTGVARDGSAARVFFSSLSVEITPNPLGALGYSPGTVSPSTPFASAVISGGLAPYTYAWTADGGFSVSNPTASSTKFVSPGLGPGDSADGTGYLTITDANGTTADATVPLNSYNTHP